MFLLPSKKNKLKEKAYESEIKRLKQKVNSLQYELGDPRYVLKKLLAGDISSYDWQGLTDIKVKKDYAQKAKSILTNPVFKNETNSLYGDLVKEIAMESQNFEVVRDLRMQISGVKLIQERLESIGTSKEPNNNNPFKEV